MNWYIYGEDGQNVAVVHATDLLTAQKEAKEIGYEGYSIERA